MKIKSILTVFSLKTCRKEVNLNKIFLHTLTSISKNPPSITSNINPSLEPARTLSKKHSSECASTVIKYWVDLATNVEMTNNIDGNKYILSNNSGFLLK